MKEREGGYLFWVRTETIFIKLSETARGIDDYFLKLIVFNNC